ncbi:Bax inhibitor-1/YccA family protein [Novosphingobium sp. G106]|uniref:Bax inhibitor-1/YccA family protein n=1 Tax=Novosphingobium sp. G106 TaxID=2849500 RepID=UPI001C2CFE18|nr:Bax inhibitor-1/YccA family protein [Novosphingobium sp. G106]MBV1689116.1 Bax inhibitor-1/YccA family protein [Novosphingobium sp. G106]
MANWNDPQLDRSGFGASPSLNGAAIGGATYDQGLRRHMLSIYNYMASGVLLSGVVALLVASSEAGQQMMRSPLWLVLAIAPLGFVFAMSFGLNRMKTTTLQGLYWAFCTVMGLSMATIFVRYTGTSIATAFFAAAASFAGLSLVGYTTKKSLSGLGTFMTMGLIGLLVAMVINMIWPMPGLAAAIPFLGVLIFAGLTAWDTQRLKNEYQYVQGTELAGKVVVMGALSLYLDFVNMFQFLLSILGDRR